MPAPTHDLGYAAPSQGTGPPVAPLVLVIAGAVICLVNWAGTVAEGGEFFFAPGLGFISFLVFVAGAISSTVHWRRRHPWSGWLLLLSVAGTVLSVVLACAGLPRR